MSFVELDRTFEEITRDDDLDSQSHSYWGSLFSEHAIRWPNLLARKRVVLLAEALSGKTEEFKNAVSNLVDKGEAAFLVPIEELADDGFVGSLAPPDIARFQHWKNSAATGYFFLDSIDEARLNRKSFDTALKKLSRDIDTDLARAHVYVSCRVSDWKGSSDRQAILERIPIPEERDEADSPDPETALLSPIFDKNTEKDEDAKSSAKEEPQLYVVRISPLDRDQQLRLARSQAIADPDEFMQAVWQNGLEPFAERPGELIELIEYWKRHKKFGRLAEMTAEGVTRKLSELDRYRPDNEALTLKRAVEGAEEIAAALTFCKSFTLKAPSQEADPELSAGAINAANLLLDWSDAELTTLLRRGIFAPATYGRVRFHQRRTQEFLAARWLYRQVQQGKSRKTVFELLFAEVYGVKVVVPSLKAITAWLSLWDDDIRHEALAREPLLLIQHGDPGSLPIETRQQLLHTYSSMDMAGDISDDSLDHRSLWMFADKDLEQAIRETWAANERRDFRTNLLVLIREGSLKECSNLAAAVALDNNQDFYSRALAVQALVACKDSKTLHTFVAWILANAKSIGSKHASQLARDLFPDYLSIDDLLFLIQTAPPPPEGTSEGFGFHLKHYWRNCPKKERVQLAQGLIVLICTQK